MIMTLGKKTEAVDRVPSLRDTASMPAARGSKPVPVGDDQILRYAPLLKFSRDETYFPIDPADFIARAHLRRYGWSDDVRDAVWHPGRACGETAAQDLPISSGAEGPDIAL